MEEEEEEEEEEDEEEEQEEEMHEEQEEEMRSRSETWRFPSDPTWETQLSADSSHGSWLLAISYVIFSSHKVESQLDIESRVKKLYDGGSSHFAGHQIAGHHIVGHRGSLDGGS